MANLTPFSDVFSQGHRNHLQHTNCCVAEKVILQLVRPNNVPVLLVHHSLITYHAFGNMGELEEVMGREYRDYFNGDIKVSEDIRVNFPS